MTTNVNDCFFYIKNGANIKQGVISGGIPITRIETLANDTFNRDKMGYAGIHDKKKYTEYILQDGDILMSHINSMAYLGRAVMYKMQKNECIIPGMNLLRLKANRNFILPEYAEYYFKSNTFKKYINKIAKKSVNQASFSIADLKSIPLFLPNMVEQKKIYNTLNRIDSIILLKNQQLKKLDLLTKALFAEMFGTFPKNEKNFRRCKIGDIVDEVKYGSSRKASENNSGKYPYLRMNNITYEGKLDLSDIKTIDIPDNELDKCMVKKGDVLFNRTNSKDLVGKTCVYDRDEMMILAGFIIRVRVNNNVLPEFLSAFLNTDFSKKMLREKCKAAIGQANINAQELKSIGIYIPPIDLQHKFKNTIIQIDKHKLLIID